MLTKVLCHLLNFGMVDATFINVVSRYSKLETVHSTTWWKTAELAFVSRKWYIIGEKSELQSYIALSI